MLGDPGGGGGGAVSREEGIFMGERKSTTSKLLPMKIPSSRLTAPWVSQDEETQPKSEK